MADSKMTDREAALRDLLVAQVNATNPTTRPNTAPEHASLKQRLEPTRTMEQLGSESQQPARETSHFPALETPDSEPRAPIAAPMTLSSTSAKAESAVVYAAAE